MNILIVEDDPVSLALLKKAKLKAGQTAIAARNGEEARERFVADQPRIVISDGMLPGLTGIDLCRRIRAAQASGYIYFIIMTAKDRKEDVLAAFEAGADDYVAKP